MTLYIITQELHSTVQTLAKQEGIEIRIKGKCIVDYNSKIRHLKDGLDNEDKSYPSAIQEDQILDILVAFEGILGDDPERLEILHQIERQKAKLENKDFLFDKIDNKIDISGKEMARYKNWLHTLHHNEAYSIMLPKLQAEALHKRYLCGYPKSLFKLDPVSVLTELNDILKSKIK